MKIHVETCKHLDWKYDIGSILFLAIWAMHSIPCLNSHTLLSGLVFYLSTSFQNVGTEIQIQTGWL